MDMPRRLGAEFFGTFWLTFAGCGSAVLAAGFPALGIGFLGVSLAFGLTVLTMAYAVGHISGGHFNSAVTIGLWAGGRFKASDVIPYIIAQVAGAIVASAALYAIASGKPDWVVDGFASNGFGDLSPGKYGLMSVSPQRGHRNFFLSVRDHWHDLKGSSRRICRHSNWTMPDSDPPVPNSCHKRVREPGS
jgi:glycerol uptake facilitator-like aquaporin